MRGISDRVLLHQSFRLYICSVKRLWNRKFLTYIACQLPTLTFNTAITEQENSSSLPIDGVFISKRFVAQDKDQPTKTSINYLEHSGWTVKYLYGKTIFSFLAKVTLALAGRLRDTLLALFRHLKVLQLISLSQWRWRKNAIQNLKRFTTKFIALQKCVWCIHYFVWSNDNLSNSYHRSHITVIA